MEGGIDIIKDDHGLCDQVFSPFEERVVRCADAVKEANVKFSRHSIYVPNITAPVERIFDRAVFAKEHGAGGLLLSPGLTGLDTLRRLSSMNIREMLDRYGQDTLVLVGSGLFRCSGDLIANCRRFMDEGVR